MRVYTKSLLLAALIGSAFKLFAVETVQADQSNSTEKLPEYSSFVVQAMLEDLGMSLDDGIKKKSTDDKKEESSSDSLIPRKKDDENPPKPTPEPVKKSSSKQSDRFSQARNRFEKRYDETLKRWAARYQQVKGEWQKENEKYQAEEEQLASQAYDFSLASEPSADALAEINSPQTMEQILASMAPGDFHVIPNALELPIRNQNQRGTCAAFAGVRAVETLIIQNDANGGRQVDLSEQHFYWMSKPNCKQTPCRLGQAAEGSWFDDGFHYSKVGKSPSSALLDEAACPYIPVKNKQNLTFTPLKACYVKAKARITDFEQFLTMDDIIPRLNQNQPIAAGFKLTNSYRKTKGVVKIVDPANKVKATGEHVAGHAMLLVGFIKLPESLVQNEGSYCAIMANSWGPGYGIGGYACLTEKWMEANRFQLPKTPERGIFTALKSINLI